MNADSFATNRANSRRRHAHALQALRVELLAHFGVGERLHVSAWMRATISGGAPAGSHSPNQLMRL